MVNAHFFYFPVSPSFSTNQILLCMCSLCVQVTPKSHVKQLKRSSIMHQHQKSARRYFIWCLFYLLLLLRRFTLCHQHHSNCLRFVAVLWQSDEHINYFISFVYIFYRALNSHNIINMLSNSVRSSAADVRMQMDCNRQPIAYAKCFSARRAKKGIIIYITLST